MLRLAAPGLLGTIMFCVWVYAVLDVIASESTLVRNLPKPTWIFLVIFVPAVGAVAWLALGRPINSGWRPGDTAIRPRRTVRGLEDSEEWSRGQPPKASRPSIEERERRLAEREAELRRREAELDERDDD